jgi:DNA adenine methylase
VLKWAGGKTQLLSVLTKKIPKKYNKFIEPFIGGGALFFYLNRPNSIIADTNGELINLYTQLSKNSKKIITKLKEYKNTKDFFYEIRKKIPNSNIDRACRTIFLNKTCFNGLYRVNKKGEFNVPYGNNKTSNFIDEENLKLVEKLLKKTKIVHNSYEYVLNKYAEKNDFIFLDPPYYPVSKYSDFKRYGII